ncbi:MAG TPA: 2-hydroxychromene-2-carboxylate isomerase [Casimicrobiaceae bacterium]|nr:2-hydroxychromene-2-carboxylate isomerase [Casimicrobiaceae bacterium]
MKHVDYYFTPVSPFTYLGHDRLVAVASRHGASVAVKPVDIGKIFSVSGGLPLKQRAPQRQAYRLFELKRWRELLSMPLNLQPKFFPVPGDPASKWILAALERSTAEGLKLAGAIMRAVWVEERDVSDAATLAALAAEQGLDAVRLGRRAGEADIGARYDALTQEAIERQVFGSPTYIYRDEPFWGQDRLDFLDRALAK